MPKIIVVTLHCQKDENEDENADAKRASVATPMRASIGCDEGRFISPEECALAPSALALPRSGACDLNCHPEGTTVNC